MLYWLITRSIREEWPDKSRPKSKPAQPILNSWLRHSRSLFSSPTHPPISTGSKIMESKLALALSLSLSLPFAPRHSRVGPSSACIHKERQGQDQACEQDVQQVGESHGSLSIESHHKSLFHCGLWCLRNGMGQSKQVWRLAHMKIETMRDDMIYYKWLFKPYIAFNIVHAKVSFMIRYCRILTSNAKVWPPWRVKKRSRLLTLSVSVQRRQAACWQTRERWLVYRLLTGSAFNAP